MNNVIEVSYRKGAFNVVSSIQLETRDRIFGLSSAKDANIVAKNLKERYERDGINISHLILW